MLENQHLPEVVITRHQSRVFGQTENAKQAKVLAAIVITPNEKTKDVGSLVAIARGAACKREHVQENPVVRALEFVPKLGVYVAVYEVPTQNLREENRDRQAAS